MKKKYLFMMLLIVINGCGSNNNGNKFSGMVTINEEDGSYYLCHSQTAYDDCLGEDANCSECRIVRKCKVEGDTVIGLDGKICDYGLHKLECNNGTGTVDNHSTGKAVVLNGMTYNCIKN